MGTLQNGDIYFLGYTMPLEDIIIVQYISPFSSISAYHYIVLLLIDIILSLIVWHSLTLTKISLQIWLLSL